jgi:glutamate carboxypeptidase
MIDFPSQDQTNKAIERLRRFVECESPSYDPVAIADGLELVRQELGASGFTIMSSLQDMESGTFFAEFNDSGRLSGRPILIACHFDTVHPVGELSINPWRIEGDRCFGPGVLDMKGGIALAILAVELASKKLARPVRILMTSDEEIGSARSRERIEAHAFESLCVLVPEPARENGGLVVGRHAVQRYELQAKGMPFHAGRDPSRGQSAINLLARKIVSLEGQSRPDASISVGVISGGQWVNCVPEKANAEMICVTSDVKSREGLRAIISQEQVENFKIIPGLERPAWVSSVKDHELYSLASRVASELRIKISPEISGGGSDGNFTGALGIPTLDGLGPCGEGAHTHSEHLHLSSFVPRAALFANILSRM